LQTHLLILFLLFFSTYDHVDALTSLAFEMEDWLLWDI